MSSHEIPVTLTPQQAAYGVILTVDLPTGTARLRIPPAQDGALVRARVGDAEVHLRIRVAVPAAAWPGPGPGQPGPAGTTGARRWLVPLAVVAALVIALVLYAGWSDGDTVAYPTPSDSPTATDTPTPSDMPTADDTPAATDKPAPPSVPAYPGPLPSETEADPFDQGTCLNGPKPNSSTAQRVTGMHEVPCSASDAHYRVIERIPLTSDLNRCNSNPRTEYSFSHRYTRGGITVNEYVYCLVGIGPYARGN
ncbi:hypothetical protein [Streptomyces sp. NPDC090022]|uniref:LppU/SCO3897 family protein n=1 Tax=Streptomyces sp. NPDC090022 TaxID=3365920 RepID=UPI00381D2FC0